MFRPPIPPHDPRPAFALHVTTVRTDRNSGLPVAVCHMSVSELPIVRIPDFLLLSTGGAADRPCWTAAAACYVWKFGVNLFDRVNYCATSTTAEVCTITSAQLTCVGLDSPCSTFFLCRFHPMLSYLRALVQPYCYWAPNQPPPRFLVRLLTFVGPLWVMSGPHIFSADIIARWSLCYRGCWSYTKNCSSRWRAHNTHPSTGGRKPFISTYVAFASSWHPRCAWHWPCSWEVPGCVLRWRGSFT